MGEELFDEGFPRKAEVIANVCKDRRESARAECTTCRGDRDVVFAVLIRRKPRMASGLARHGVPES